MTLHRTGNTLVLGALEFELHAMNLISNAEPYQWGDSYIPSPLTRQTIEFRIAGKDCGVLTFGGNGFIGHEVRFIATCDTTEFHGRFRIQSLRIDKVIEGLPSGKLEGTVVGHVKIVDLGCKKIDISTHDTPTNYLIKHHPNCRCVQTPIKEESVEKVTAEDIKKNKFYVGHKSTFTRDWGHAKLEDAITHGKELLELNDGEDQIIVKIVKVIRRKPQPVVVEDVK